MKERPPGYDKYIQSAQWRGISALMKKQAKYLCQDCKKPSSTLETHHLNYERFGCERLTDLRVLCKPCHDEADEKREAEVRQRASNAWHDACEASANRGYDTYMTKVHGERYDLIETEQHREKFDAWKEKRDERDYWRS